MAHAGDSAGLAGARREASSEWDGAVTTLGWGLVILLVGAVALPDGPIGYAAIATVGALMLALDVTVVVRRRELDLFSTALGATALVAGAGALAGTRIAAFALFFLLLGSAFVLVALVRAIRGGRPIA